VQNTIAMMQWQDTGRDAWAAKIEDLKRKRTEREAARQIHSRRRKTTMRVNIIKIRMLVDVTIQV